MAQKTRLLLLLCGFFCPLSAQVEPAFVELIDLPKVRDCAMNETGTVVWFTVQSPLEERSIIAWMEVINDQWSKPELMPFSDKWNDMEPFLSPDGLHLYFASNRPLHPDSTLAKDMDIWVVDRQSPLGSWSTPRNLGNPVNTAGDEFYPAVAANGNLYFTRKPADSDRMDDLYLSTWTRDGYAPPEPIGDEVNSPGYEYNAYVAPDESYLIFGAYHRPDGFGSGDLYISHRSQDGKWSVAQNLGPDVNSSAMDYCPLIHEFTGMFYFTSRRSQIGIESISGFSDFLQTVQQYENGYSRLYRMPIGTLLQKE